MATTTPNFGWDVPQSTDLVKDGATAIAALGNDIDTSLVDLKGGTTGQVLSKASNTDMDFTWVAQDDSNAIQNAIVDAKGDLITATAADTPARLAVGSNNQVLTADSSTATGLKWATPAAGGMTLISTTSLTGASVSLSSIPSTYIHLQLVIQNFKPASDNECLLARINGDSTANRHKSMRLDGDVSGQNATSFDETSFRITGNNDNSVATGLAVVDLWDYTNAATWKFASVQSIGVNATTTTSFNPTNYFGAYNQTGAVTSLTLLSSSGNLTSGTVLLYGVK